MGREVEEIQYGNIIDKTWPVTTYGKRPSHLCRVSEMGREI